MNSMMVLGNNILNPKFECWIKELGLFMNLSELGVKEDIVEGIADGTVIMEGGYKVLTRDEIVSVLKEECVNFNRVRAKLGCATPGLIQKVVFFL